jgi:hypothetical protein
MTITNRTKPRDVMEAVQKHLNARLKYGSAHKVLLSLQGKGIDIERDQFRLLPAYIELLKKRDPDGRYFLSRDDNTARFQRIFVCPSACKKQFMVKTTVAERKGGIRRCSVLQFVVARAAGSATMHAIVLALILRVGNKLGGMLPKLVF